ncbi:MAG: DUF3795 domain-containing protein [Defluviitaleaceae bacterium]|nr:DUF3795 domain-containing protein [Defluviitaleaceae bacterium]
MNKTEHMQSISGEIMRFMRGKYALDEIGNGADELKFCENEETVFSIRVYDDRYDFHIDGDCISVVDLHTLEIVKQKIQEKRKPNRKPFPKEGAIFGKCGQRCDLCWHYSGKTNYSEDIRSISKERAQRVYGSIDGIDRKCGGCDKGGINNGFDCGPMKCAAQRSVNSCMECSSNASCSQAMAGLRPEVHTKIILADDVTWAILPFVHGQYGN